jgi:hypothetical protein
MKSFVDAIRNGENGIVFENSVFLPFHLELLRVWIGKEMTLISSPECIVDVCPGNGDVAVREGELYTNLVFRRYRDLPRELGHDKGHVILHAAEKGADIFRKENLHYIRLGFQSGQKEIALEVIDDPFLL